MTCDTISNNMTMAGGVEGALLAGRYLVVRQLGQGWRGMSRAEARRRGETRMATVGRGLRPRRWGHASRVTA